MVTRQHCVVIVSALQCLRDEPSYGILQLCMTIMNHVDYATAQVLVYLL